MVDLDFVLQDKNGIKSSNKNDDNRKNTTLPVFNWRTYYEIKITYAEICK